MDSGRRTFVKATIWTILGFLMMAATGLIFTGSVAVGGAMALANTVIGAFSYVIYERVWSRIGWGRLHG